MRNDYNISSRTDLTKEPVEQLLTVCQLQLIITALREADISAKQAKEVLHFLLETE